MESLKHLGPADQWAVEFSEEPSAVVRMTEATRALEAAIAVFAAMSATTGRADLVPGLELAREELQLRYKIEATRNPIKRPRVPESKLRKAAALRAKEGLTIEKAAERAGVSFSSLKRHLNPKK